MIYLILTADRLLWLRRMNIENTQAISAHTQTRNLSGSWDCYTARRNNGLRY
jgi:hypothetical protein